jgi:hypothetical protein
MRSAIESRVSRSCVTIKTVIPRSWHRNCSSRSNARAVIGSRPEVGSSRNSTSGSSASARAMAARLRMPPDSSLGILAPTSAGRPASDSRRSTSGPSSIGRHVGMLQQGRGDVGGDIERREQRAVLEHHAEAPAHRRAAPAGRCAQTSVPSSRTRPHWGAAARSSRAAAPTCRCRCRRSARPVRRGGSRLTPSCTTCEPKRVTTESTSITGASSARHTWRVHQSSSWNSTANSASSRITATMLCTTVDVVWMPIERVSRLTVMPMRQPITAMSRANTGALPSPIR